MPSAPYPVQFSVDYPDRPLNRVTTFFRLFAVIPIAIVLGAVDGAQVTAWSAAATRRPRRSCGAGGCWSSPRC